VSDLHGHSDAGSLLEAVCCALLFVIFFLCILYL